MNDTTNSEVIGEAVAAYKLGITPVPIMQRTKRPSVPNWQKISYDSAEELVERFEGWQQQGMTNIGVLLGDRSDGLLDVDIDHPKAARLRHHFLPPTPARSGREGRPGTHYWYRAKPGTTPATRQHKIYDGKDGAVSVELRSTRAQTLIPSSIHPSGERYVWEGAPWGGEAGIAEIHGSQLAAQVALLALGAQLLESWPSSGSRHTAYLALAGALLWAGDYMVHPFWETNAAPLIRAMADVTFDDDGPDAREREVIDSTIKSIREGKNVVGFGKLAEVLGEEQVRQVRILIEEVESAAGYEPRNARNATATQKSSPSAPGAALSGSQRRGAQQLDPAVYEDEEGNGALLPPHLQSRAASEDAEADEREVVDSSNPLENRASSWEIIDPVPYLNGLVETPKPSTLLRDDGQALMYSGRLNMLYGSSESAKSWIALKMCVQAIKSGQRAVYLDFEDEPASTYDRMRMLGADVDELVNGFYYVRPEDPLADMQRDRWGKAAVTALGERNAELLAEQLALVDPTLIVADGLTMLYGMHGLDTNSSAQTDVITSWLKSLTRNGRSTVVVIDHSGKGAARGDLPIGSQHKVSMVQGTMLQAWPTQQPMPGAVGEIELIVLKDRPGGVRAISRQGSGTGKAQVAAIITMDSKTNPNVVDMQIAAPDATAPGVGGTVTVGGHMFQESEKDKRLREKIERVDAVVDTILEELGGDLSRELTMTELVQVCFPVETDRNFVQQVVRIMAAVPRSNEGGQPHLRHVQQWLVREGLSKSSKYRLAIS